MKSPYACRHPALCGQWRWLLQLGSVIAEFEVDEFGWIADEEQSFTGWQFHGRSKGEYDTPNKGSSGQVRGDRRADIEEFNELTCILITR